MGLGGVEGASVPDVPAAAVEGDEAGADVVGAAAVCPLGVSISMLLTHT